MAEIEVLISYNTSSYDKGVYCRAGTCGSRHEWEQAGVGTGRCGSRQVWNAVSGKYLTSPTLQMKKRKRMPPREVVAPPRALGSERRLSPHTAQLCKMEAVAREAAR